MRGRYRPTISGTILHYAVYGIPYAFDPRRQVILLIGGDKTGDGQFYERMIPIADALYEVYLNELKDEGLIK